jgi:NAD(P)-dependent dehydrogenase (short-subunit alcohol dehydrogenase family)
MFRTDLLQGKRILVTGGGTGLGKSIARRYAELGACIVICGRRVEVLDAFTASDRRGARHRPARHVLLHRRRRSALDRRRARRHDPERGLRGVVHRLRIHGRLVGRQGGGVALTRGLAVEWGPKGIRLNAVAPGLFPTPGAWERIFPEGSQDEDQRQSIPMRRYGEPLELANMFAYLAADESAYVNGELVVIDGGRWMQGAGGPNARVMQSWTEEQWQALRKR